MNARTTCAALALMIAAACGLAFGQERGAPIQPDKLMAARRTFEKYVALEHAFEPALADLYADNAVIVNKRTYPTGQVREMTVPAPQYKDLIRKAIPIAKLKNDVSTYSECRYGAEEDRVRIVCMRYSELKKYTSPISLLVGPGPKGDWLVFEELSESQP